MSQTRTQVIRAINGATATASSSAIDITGAKRVSFVFKRSAHASGKTVFTVTVSADNSNYITYNRLISNTASTNSQTITRVAEYDTGAANATAMFSMSPEDVMKYVKVTATETTDGTHDAWVICEYEKE